MKLELQRRDEEESIKRMQIQLSHKILVHHLQAVHIHLRGLTLSHLLRVISIYRRRKVRETQRRVVR